MPSSNYSGFEPGVNPETRRALLDLRKQVAELNGVVEGLTAAIEKSPKGIVKMGVMVGQSGVAIAANVATPVTQTLSFTPLVGRRYRMYCACRASAPNTATPGGAYLRIGGTNSIAANDTWAWLGGSYQSLRIECIFVGTGVASTYTVSFVPSVAAIIYSEQQTSLFFLEDVGPV